jgi:hypothetical protein
MHWYFAEQLQRERGRELREAAELGRGRTASASARADAGEIVIRRSAPGDGAAMSALAALDGRQWRTGPALVAEVDGSLRAALPLDGAEPFSDPFRSSAEVLALLELRAVQLGALCKGRSSAGLLSRLSVAQTR